MNKAVYLLLLALPMAGCGNGEPTPADESKLRATLGQKQIDYAAVPPAQRAMVLSQMRAHGSAAKADELEKQWGMKK